MPVEQSTAALVLRARDYGETDRIVTLLTHDFGKLSGIAKGAKVSRRRFERKLEPFTHATLYFRRRPHGQLVFITRAEPGDRPTVALDELGQIALGSYMLELADALTREEAEAASAYSVLADALEALSRGAASAALRQAFELKMLGAAGFGLEFGHCRRCATAVQTVAEAVYFVPAQGGIVCARCRPQVPENAVRVTTASAAALARLSAAPLGESAFLCGGNADSALAITRFLATILDRQLRSVEFLNSLL